LLLVDPSVRLWHQHQPLDDQLAKDLARDLRLATEEAVPLKRSQERLELSTGGDGFRRSACSSGSSRASSIVRVTTARSPASVTSALSVERS